MPFDVADSALRISFRYSESPPTRHAERRASLSIHNASRIKNILQYANLSMYDWAQRMVYGAQPVAN